MNVWKILKPYLPDFLYVEFPKPLYIKADNLEMEIGHCKIAALKKLDRIIEDFSIEELIIGNRSYNEIVINSENIRYFWHLLGFVYKRMNIIRRDSSTPLVFGSPSKERIESLEKLMKKFRRFPFRIKEYIYNNKMLYIITFPRYLSYIAVNFLKVAINEEHIKRFLSECISRYTRNNRVIYRIILSKGRYDTYGSLDRLLNILNMRYSKHKLLQNRRYKKILYYIHSKSKPFAEEIYNMSIFRWIRRRS